MNFHHAQYIKTIKCKNGIFDVKKITDDLIIAYVTNNNVNIIFLKDKREYSFKFDHEVGYIKINDASNMIAVVAKTKTYLFV